MKAKTMITIDLNTMTCDEYVAFRMNWREEYKALSAEIRETKLRVKNLMKAGQSTDNLQNDARDLAHDATNRLDTLQQAKARLKEISGEVACAA